ncbi:MAG: methyltransferase family protein [Hyphomicrobiaceae bacterium]
MGVVDVKKIPGPFTGWSELPRKTVAMELVERLYLLGLFGYFLHNMLGNAGLSFVIGLLILSETLPLLLVFSRGPSETLSLKPADWLFGLAGASAPLLAMKIEATPLAPFAFCLTLMLVGFVIQLSGKIFLGRSFGVIAANRGVKVSGPYRIVRHPIYAGYTLTHIGFLLINPAWWNFALYSIGLGLQIVRILKEERVLSEDPAYREMKERVRYRLLPGVF